MKTAVVIGSGAGGATAAKELQGHFDVTILEAGGEFKPLGIETADLEKAKNWGMLRSEKEIGFVFRNMQMRRSTDGAVMVNGRGVGGSTAISAGNGLRMDAALQAIGVDLDTQFGKLASEIPVSTAHQKGWRPATKDLFEICLHAGMAPAPTPKMGDYGHCRGCGRCVLGCPYGVKWDSRRFVEEAVSHGAKLVTGTRVERAVIENGHATGVIAKTGLTRRFVKADLIVLAAGGFSTPVILQNSGISCEDHLFVDHVLCVAAEWKNAQQHREISMPFVVQREGYILSPYFDYLSFLFNRSWRFPARDTLSLMVKLADDEIGRVSGRIIEKCLTSRDRKTLNTAVAECREILRQFGIKPENTALGTVNAGHPGGMLPLTAGSAASLHDDRLPSNVYVADATLLPHSLGNPPILTIAALAKKVSKNCIDLLG